jgi:hypothetical protein
MADTVIHEADLAESGGDIGQARRQIEFLVASIRARGGKLLKLRHSSELKQGVRRYLKKLRAEERISFFVEGERFSESDVGSIYLVEKYPAVANDPDLAAADPHVTVLAL